MNQLQVIVHDNRRVLTTAQLAESYGTISDRISKNFSENKDRYKEGKHFILLQGDELKRFKDDFLNSELVKKNASMLYLWTEKGAWLHAKSLNTDAAWDAYEMLVDEYYKIQEQKPLTAREQMLLLMRVNEETAQRVDAIEEKVNVLHETMRIDGIQQRTIQCAAKKKAIDSLGGSDTKAYKDLSGKVFRAIWKEFNTHFQLPRYGELPKSKFEDALYFISKWRPSTTLEIEIEACNKQEKFHLV